MLTNFGSMRDPFNGCRTVSFIGFIGSQPKHVLKISANSNVVPSFCKHHFFHDRQIDTESKGIKKKVLKKHEIIEEKKDEIKLCHELFIHFFLLGCCSSFFYFFFAFIVNEGSFYYVLLFSFYFILFFLRSFLSMTLKFN